MGGVGGSAWEVKSGLNLMGMVGEGLRKGRENTTIG